MGGGLAFLNKKSWHPGGFKQQETVWKREQEKAQEERRLDELKKQIAEEREAQELMRQAQEAGHVTKVERLEFMYKGSLGDGPTLQRPTPAAEAAAPAAAPPSAAAPSAGARALGVYTDDTPKARNEAWARLHGDPMLLIKQQEQASLKTLRANPVKMDAILREVEALKSERRERKEAKRERKESRREKKESRRARRDGSESSSSGRRGRGGSPQRRRSPPRCASPARRRSRSRSRSRGRERERVREPHSRVNDAACAQRGDAGYGLTFASAQAEAAARANAAQARPAYEPSRGAPAVEPPRNWAKGSNSLRHTAGRLSESERAARLQAMSADANTHEEERWQRLRREEQREAAEGVGLAGAAAPAHHHAVKPAFLGEQERQMFGAGSSLDLAERVGALKHYREREAT